MKRPTVTKTSTAAFAAFALLCVPAACSSDSDNDATNTTSTSDGSDVIDSNPEEAAAFCIEYETMIDLDSIIQTAEGGQDAVEAQADAFVEAAPAEIKQDAEAFAVYYRDPTVEPDETITEAAANIRDYVQRNCDS